MGVRKLKVFDLWPQPLNSISNKHSNPHPLHFDLGYLCIVFTTAIFQP
jgi:hypothetical protein